MQRLQGQLSKLQGSIITCQLQVTPTRGQMRGICRQSGPRGIRLGAHRAFPIEGTGRCLTVEFLIVEERHDSPNIHADMKLLLDRITNTGSARTPEALHAKFHLWRVETLNLAVGVAPSGTGPQ